MMLAICHFVELLRPRSALSCISFFIACSPSLRCAGVLFGPLSIARCWDCHISDPLCPRSAPDLWVWPLSSVILKSIARMLEMSCSSARGSSSPGSPQCSSRDVASESEGDSEPPDAGAEDVHEQSGGSSPSRSNASLTSGSEADANEEEDEVEEGGGGGGRRGWSI